jgi:hypothetical protein
MGKDINQDQLHKSIKVMVKLNVTCQIRGYEIVFLVKKCAVCPTVEKGNTLG